MLLKELVDLERIRTTKQSLDPHTFPERVAGKQKNLKLGKETKPLGSGVSAVAFPGKKPGTTNKTSYHSSPNDGYIQYIKTIQKHQDNPFFPRIHHAKIYKENDTYALNMQVEKLVPLQHPKMIKTAPHIFRQLGLDWSQYGEDVSTEETPSWKYKREIWEDDKKINEMIANTNNPKFAEAIKVLAPFMKQFGSDLHLGNFMVRLTGSGPQLVITDPVKPSKVVYSDIIRPNEKRARRALGLPTDTPSGDETATPVA